MKKITLGFALICILSARATQIQNSKDAQHLVLSQKSGSIQEILDYLESYGYEVISIEPSAKEADVFYCEAIKNGQSVFLRVTQRERVITHDEIIL